MEENRKIANKIIDKLEDLLKEHEIKIPNEERCNNEDEACIYGKDYYKLEDEITEILDNCISNNNLKNKLKLWVEKIKQEKDVDKAISYFEELFKKECTPIYTQEVDEYFESYNEKYELNDNIVVEQSWGSWDKFGSQVSHRGTDINVYFKKSKKEENREGITISFESEYKNNIEKLEKMLEEEMTDEVII